MARKEQRGIIYYSQDSNNVQNTKIKLLINEFDSHGYWIWECLKCEIYSKKGYYMDTNNEDELIIFASDVCKKPVSLVKEVIIGCVRRGLFDRAVFDAFKVLTSDRIQSNYLAATYENRKKKEYDVFKEYWVLKPDKNIKNIYLISLENDNYREIFNSYRENEEKYREILPKENERKLNEIKGNEKKEAALAFTPPDHEDVICFFKSKIQETSWTEKKCAAEAKNFIDYYAKTDWITKNGPITNWQNAASGWISNDEKFQKNTLEKKNKGKVHPNNYSKIWMNSLTIDEQREYREHLKSLGFVEKRDHQNFITGWEKKY